MLKMGRLSLIILLLITISTEATMLAKVSCEDSGCLNGGICVTNSSRNMYGKMNSEYCKCKSGFFGEFCEQSKHEYYGIPSDNNCDTRGCLNGGSCVLHNHENKTAENIFYCRCAPGNYGEFCEGGTSIVFEACFHSPCNNGATCVPLGKDEVVPKYQQPAWIHPSWIPRYFAARQVQNQLQSDTWDGRQMATNRQKRSPIQGKQYMNPSRPQKPQRSVPRAMPTQSKNSRVPLYMRLLMPKALQKKRPYYKIDYKCICAYGFTGYNCQTNVCLWRNLFARGLGMKLNQALSSLIKTYG